MKKSVFTSTVIFVGLFISNLSLTFGQTSALIQRTDATGSKLYEYYLSSINTPRLLYPYNSSSFSSTNFLFELKVDGYRTTKGFRISRLSTDYAVELLNETNYGIFQTGTGLVNYFGSKTAIGGTAAYNPLATLHVNGNSIITDKLGVGLSSAPAGNLQVASADSVLVRFDPVRTRPVSFVNSAEASCFQFWSLRDNANPIEKGDGSETGGTGYSKILAFTINPTGEIVSKYAVVEHTITTNCLGASKSIGSPLMVTDTFQLRTNAGEGKLMISDRSGVASWADVTEIFPQSQYWQSNGNGGIYTDKFSVGIKTGLTGPYDLAVNGVIGCKELKVEINSAIWNWPDYVFAPGYHLPALSDVEQFVKVNGHLPEVPSAENLKADGVSVGEMQATLLKKVEELTLYLIEQQKTIKEQQEQINQLKDIIQNR